MSHPYLLDLSLPTEESLLEFAATLAKLCTPPLVIFLKGDLGAGKTCFARGFLRGLAYRGKVKSPTYNLVEAYEVAQMNIFHFDFYRIQEPAELDFIGIQDYWQSSAIFLIEWPEKGGRLLPPVDLTCFLEVAGNGRKLQIQSESVAGEKLVAKLLK